jgi:hypothetical protein
MAGRTERTGNLSRGLSDYVTDTAVSFPVLSVPPVARRRGQRASCRILASLLATFFGLQSKWSRLSRFGRLPLITGMLLCLLRAFSDRVSGSGDRVATLWRWRCSKNSAPSAKYRAGESTRRGEYLRTRAAADRLRFAR